MSELQAYFTKMQQAGAVKLVISKPGKAEPYKKIVVEHKGSYYQISSYTEKQVFHENVPVEQLARRCAAITEGHYGQVNGFSPAAEHMLLISKKGAVSYKEKKLNRACTAPVDRPSDSHNRRKQYILEEGREVPPLVDMGVFTREGKVVRSMYDKYRQINRFLEILDDEIGASNLTELNVIDFGCGKSYLTFIVYYYLTEVKGIKANIIGLDLKADVIKKCNQSAQRYGYTGLHFELGDINGYQAPFDVDLVITLHACDTATDFALYNAIRWNARMIFSVPCCQHELNGQMKPESLGILSRYGILKERFSAIATDAIRGNLLEYCGYRTQLLEFIDFAHTPKNILIRAVRRPVVPKSVKNKALNEVHALMDEFHFEPTLYQLLDLPARPAKENETVSR